MVPSKRHVLLFCRQLVALLKSGTSLVRALTVLQVQPDCPALGQILTEVVTKVESGHRFSAALNAHPRVFAKVFVASVEVGESSGRLYESLERQAQWLELDPGVRFGKEAADRAVQGSEPALVCEIGLCPLGQ